jgi:copper/silver efflux system protein
MKLATLLTLVVLAGCGDGGHDHATPETEQGAAAAEKWLCPMHPTYIDDRKSACPICGMDLVPATEFLAEQGGGASGVPGMAALELSDEAIRLAGVRTRPAVVEALTTRIRAVGLVTADETRVRSVQTRVTGWIESLAVSAVGTPVSEGEPLLTLYSPELVASQEELLRAIIRLDALPDLSDTQVIVYSRWDRSPDIIEDQVTYPITAAAARRARVKAIRGFSDFGFSYVYVIFEDGTDIYWARSRVLEYLSKIQPRLPGGREDRAGPRRDRRRLGLPVRAGRPQGTPLARRAALVPGLDLRYALQAVPGVAEVASIGGFVAVPGHRRPERLAAYGVPLDEVVTAVREQQRGRRPPARVLAAREYMVRGRGYAKSVAGHRADRRQDGRGGTPVLLGDVATVELGPEIRRGRRRPRRPRATSVGGIVVMRHGENALNVIERVKAEARGARAVAARGASRSSPPTTAPDLIERAIDTLTHELLIEMIIVSLVILIFLWHIPSAIVPIVTIPIAVLLAFIPLYYMGVTPTSCRSPASPSRSACWWTAPSSRWRTPTTSSTSGGGRAPGDFHAVRLRGAAGGGAVGLLLAARHRRRLHARLHAGRPGGAALQAARLLEEPRDGHRGAPGDHARPGDADAVRAHGPVPFRPRWLAWVANRSLVGHLPRRGEAPDQPRPSSAIYEPPAASCCATRGDGRRRRVLWSRRPPRLPKLGSEFMPPSTRARSSTCRRPARASRWPRRSGCCRCRTASSSRSPRSSGSSARRAAPTPPPTRRPFSMMETTVLLKPEDEWRASERWYSEPGRRSGCKRGLRPIWRDRISWDELVDEMDRALRLPGRRTPGRCRSRPASTCSPPASARRSGSRSSARPE